MGSIIKWIVFLLGVFGLGASKKRKEEVKKIDKKVKENKKQVKKSKKKADSIKKTEAKKKQIKKKFTEENDDEAAKFLKDFASK